MANSVRKKQSQLQAGVAYPNRHEIIKCTDEDLFTIIVMATHGRSGLSRRAYGSVVDKVLPGMFFVNPSKWAHILNETACVLGRARETFLGPKELAAIDGQSSPEGSDHLKKCNREVTFEAATDDTWTVNFR
jgi:Universal stress protein family